jgi:aspartyl-tRNA(Asn)/glutamyl-tRNA(Gln) amidotransferase subunit A
LITSLTASELAHKLASKEVSATEVAEAYLSRIEDLDHNYGCFLTVTREKALADAAEAQTLIDRGEAGPLTGVPIAVKDNMSTSDIRTTCASKILDNFVPVYDATAVDRLKAAGMVMVGKTNLDEFAMGTSTENSAYQLTKNPWDVERSPGGSSGGSAAAVAAGLTPLSLGSDTGGSIRQPASLCGIVGYKPTYGRVSRYGLVAFASSLDQIGPFGRTVEDAARLAEVISGHDPMDSTSIDCPPISAGDLKKGSLRGLKIAVPEEMMGQGTSDGVRACIDSTIDLLTREGAEVRRISLPSIKFGVTTYYIIAPAEASSNLARFDGIRYGYRAEGSGHIEVTERSRGRGFGHEVKTRIMIGTYALSAGYYDAYYLRAQQVRALMTREFDAAFQDCDCILSPTSPVTAFKLGELSDDPMALKLLDYCTIPANMGGYPGISLNCGFSEGLPVGLQLVGPKMGDERLLQMAYSVEQALPEECRRMPAS